MAVQGHHRQLCGVAGGDDAGNIAVGIEGNVKLTRHTALEFEGMNGNGGILFAGDGILVRIVGGILVVLVKAGILAFPHLHVVDGDTALVVTDPAKDLRIGSEVEAPCRREFLLVHPVRDTVDDFVALAVLCHLRFCIIEKEFDHKEIVVSGKGYDVSIGREKGRCLRSAFGKGNHDATCHIIDVIDGGVGTAVNLFGLRLDEDFLLVGTHDIAVDAVKVDLAPDIADIKNDPCLLAVTEAGARNLLTVGRQLAVRNAVVEGIDTVDILGAVLAIDDVAQGELLLLGADSLLRSGGDACGGTAKKAECHNEDFVHNM